MNPTESLISQLSALAQSCENFAIAHGALKANSTLADANNALVASQNCAALANQLIQQHFAPKPEPADLQNPA